MQSSYFLNMKSLNFEFLRPKWPELAGLGGFAEAYVHSDPVGAISKLRVFCEQVVEWIHFVQRLPKPYQANLIDLLHNQPFKDVVPQVVLSKLHSLRLEGNQAARMMEDLFNEMYPKYGGKFCQTIVSDDPRAESMIDDFKGDGSNPDLTIAISVDMLDTGVDVPECVNLVFAKPVYSYVKFWQMIGRGTRLRSDLFGPELDKTHFQIFDHWGNFERFEQDYKKAEPVRQKSLCERVFEARMNLAATALEKQNTSAFDIATGLLSKQISDLPTGSIPIKEKWPQVQSVLSKNTVREFSAATRATLEQNIAPLMQWVDIAKFEEAYIRSIDCTVTGRTHSRWC